MPTKADPESWERVAETINDRLGELGWDQVDLARAAGVSDATVRKLQNASSTRYHRTTLAKVCGALGWPDDAIWRLLTAGELPPSVEPAPPSPPGRDAMSEIAELRRRVAELERMLRSESSGPGR